jgi:hypothetical protein
LIFVPFHEHLSPAEEKERYSHHHNQVDNNEYVRYLTEVSGEIDRIPVGDPLVLDFGSGYDYVLTRILREKGVRCEAYDPLYGLGAEALSGSYDIVILCETIEHLRDLRSEMLLCKRLCKSGGYILIKTRLYTTKDAFPSWWYAVDETHINFFNEHAIGYLASMIDKKIVYSNNKDLVIMGPC